MAITRLGGANAITGTLPAANINDTSIGNITALPSAIATGKVLQYKYAGTSSPVTVTSNTFTDVGITASITPTSASNTIFIDVNCPDNRKQTGNTNMNIKVYRQINGGGYTSLDFIAAGHLYTNSTITLTVGASGVLSDTTHNTTNAVDYTLYARRNTSSTGSVNVGGSSFLAQVILMEIAA